jgi:Spy/CpxP family protein refolding chaperone
VKTNMKGLLFCVMILLGGSLLIAAGQMPAAPTTEPTAVHHRSTRGLVKPWSDITTLTDDQKDKIEKIHTDSLDKQRDIRDKEKDDIEAVLTADQKKELKTMEADETAARKERAAKKKADETVAAPTTAPAQ